MTALGAVLLQLKFTTASVRVSVAGAMKVTFEKTTDVVFDQYWPSKPMPLPMAAVLMNVAVAAPLLAAPDFTAMAVTFSVVVTVNGAV